MISKHTTYTAVHKGIALALLLLSNVVALSAQTLRVYCGQICTAFTDIASQMPYTDGGSTLTIDGTTFNVSEIDSIVIDNSTVSDNTVGVTYNGTTANVVIAGNVASMLTTSVTAANVSIEQSSELADEITYTLQGTSTNGSFYMDGDLKASVVLNGLTLTSTEGAAINIQNGKRINIEIADSTTNTLVDAASGSQKACLMVNGHTEFKGGGVLNITGNTKHAFWGDEYVELKKSTGTINILSAQKDGMNINQYFEMKGGTLTMTSLGDDGISVAATDDTTDEQNGQVIISGGTINITATATAAKGISCDSLLTVSDGTLNISTSGAGTYDSDDKDTSSSSCLKSDYNIAISGGTLTLKSTGTGGKGISADGDVNISGGTISVTTTGKEYTYSNQSALPKGIKADGNVTIDGGEITVSCTGGEGAEGIESKNTLTVNDGTIIVNTYDDCLNASSVLVINGGKIYARATNNDAIDSNGTLTITGGVVIALGTTTPEGSFDCDSNTFAITGGTIIGLGGDVSTPTTSVTTQPVIILQSQTFSSGQYLALNDGDGANIFAFQVPVAYSGTKLILSSPSLSVGSSCSVNTGATVTADEAWQGYSENATVSGGTSTTVSITSVVTNSTGSTTPGGGTTGPGGGTTGPGGNTGRW